MKTAVSLHSHTSRSRETMSFIPRYVDSIPYMTPRIKYLERKYQEHHGTTFNYSRVWWTPPLEPKAAFQTESRQIEERLQRRALVSLSDHDNVDAGYALEMFAECKGSPISSEWTIPIEDSFLHIGVHNMQSARARMLQEAMQSVTANPAFEAVDAMLDELQRDPGTLIVVNHPLWDEARVGKDKHRRILTGFLDRHGRYIHALELNGLRDAKENAEVMLLAAERRLPAVSGGDRHGAEPNALVNLTAAQTFSEFAAEIREGAASHTVFMPQYEEPLKVRILQLMSDVMHTYEEFSIDRRRWSDRIFYHCEDGSVRRLSEVWTGNGPGIVGQFVAAMQLVRYRHVRAVLRLAFST